MKRVWAGAAILAISLLHFFQFPGHTWLQSDTQIYAPILEHMWDPTVLGKDLIVQHPHVAFTLYDETAIALRKATGLDFRQRAGRRAVCLPCFGHLGRLPDGYRARPFGSSCATDDSGLFARRLHYRTRGGGF